MFAPDDRPRTVRDEVYSVLRRHRMTRMFANPGSTEVPFLTNLPDDMEFVLGLHEASVVGMAAGAATATGQPSLALLHTTAGLGNAVAAIATVRENRLPVVIIVGQQDRRHLVSDPFLAGRLEGLAGEYPIWVGTPPRSVDVPSFVERAVYEATVGRGPAIVIVPMDDWLQLLENDGRTTPPPREILEAIYVPVEGVQRVLHLISEAVSPVMVVGSDTANEPCWLSLTTIAQRLDAQVWNEPFGARPGFDQTSPRFAGVLSAARDELRDQLRGHDLILVFGCHALRQYGFVEGPLFEDSVVVSVVAHAEQAMASVADLGVIAPLAPFLTTLAGALPQRGLEEDSPAPRVRPEPRGVQFTGARVLAELGASLPPDIVLLEEAPSDRSDFNRLLPAANPLGFVSAAMGGLGFALPAAVGIKLSLPGRPVVAVLGDGSSLYSIQGLWSAQRYDAGVLFIIIANGGYAIMDRLASAAGTAPAWPGFGDIGFDVLARGFGCEAVCCRDVRELQKVLSDILPSLASRNTPIVVVAEVTR